MKQPARSEIDLEIARLLKPLASYVMPGEPRARPRRQGDHPIDPQVPPPPFTILRRLTRANALDPKLAPTDRHMQRWAVGQGSGLPDPERALYRQMRLTPLEPEVAISTDQVVLAMPSNWRRLVVLWYRSDCSVEQLCEALGMGREKVFIERRVALAYLLGNLRGIGIHLAIFGDGA